MKIMQKIRSRSLFIATLWIASLPAYSALIARGEHLVYDDVLNITWLRDASFAFTSGGLPGRGSTSLPIADWGVANNWVESLVFAGSDKWRLPTLAPIKGEGNRQGLFGSDYDIGFTHDGSSDVGYGGGGTNSELGYMFYQNLGNIAVRDDMGTFQSSNLNTRFIDGETGIESSFDNVTSDYWTNVANDPVVGRSFSFAFGLSDRTRGDSRLSTHGSAKNIWVVHDGDIGARAAVTSDTMAASEPSQIGIIIFSLMGLIALRRHNYLNS